MRRAGPLQLHPLTPHPLCPVPMGPEEGGHPTHYVLCPGPRGGWAPRLERRLGGRSCLRDLPSGCSDKAEVTLGAVTRHSRADPVSDLAQPSV